MSLESGTPKLRLLLVADEGQVRAQLRAALATEYETQMIEDASGTFTGPVSAKPYDIVLIIRNSIDEVYLDSLKRALEAAPCAVVVFVNRDQDRLAAKAIRYGVTSYVVDGFELNRVPTVIELSLERFKLQQALQNELQKSQEELAARKVIERAKGLLMERKNLNEQDAYRSLRELAMRQSKSIKEVSETLILYSDILP